MRSYKYELIKYLKYKKHVSVVETRLMHLRNTMCKQAILHGSVDIIIRKQYLKYNKYLLKLRNGSK
jgi:hypothetical protein